MYLLTAQEMQNLDRIAINDLGIPGTVLMENAGIQIIREIKEMIGDPAGKTITIFAGKGNNGGDGFVVARHLLNAGAEVKVLMFADIKDITGDAKINLNILQSMGHNVHPVVNPNSLNIVKLSMLYTDLVIDAIFGTGFKGTVPDHVGKIIDIINVSGKPVIAVDIPSGLEADTGHVHGPCIKSACTVTFAQAKIGLVIKDGPEYCGHLKVVDISIPPHLVKTLPVKRFMTTPEIVRSYIPRRKAAGHKGSYGKVLVVGGSEGLSGAAALTGMAALRAGAGLVTLAVPAGIHSLMEVKLTEVMTKPLPETGEITISSDAAAVVLEMLDTADVLALGPGLSTNESTVEFVREIVPQVEKPLVIDADGLNALAGSKGIMESFRTIPVLTPHPGEMARLLGIKTEDVQNNRVEVAQDAAAKWNAVVVLKGFRTLIAGPEGTLYVNPTGNSGMASGGTGDVLTGIIAGFLGQGLTPLEAAVTGAYLHGKAGDLAAGEKGMLSLAASDLLVYLSQAAREFSMLF